MGFGAWISSIGSAFSSCVSGLKSAIGCVAASVMKAVGIAGPALSGWAGALMAAMPAIGAALQVAGAILNILKPDEKVPEIGERAIQAEEQGITLNSCNGDFKNYMQQIRDLKLDPAKMEKRSPIQQWLAGSLVVEKGLESMYPYMATIMAWPVIAKNPEFFNDNRFETYARLAMQTHMPLGEVIAKYFISGPNAKPDSAVRSFIWDAEKLYSPEESSNQIYDTLNKARENCQKPE